MLVSIIIPTYKRSDMLDRALTSCINQTYKNIEIIVIDDNLNNSKEHIKTKEIVSKYNIKYIKNKTNKGGAESRNIGIKEAKGKYITFLDDDDEFVLDKIEKQLAFMIKNKLDASFTDSIEINKTNKKIKTYNNYYDYDNILKFHLIEMIVTTGTFMIKKEVLECVNYFTKVPAGQEYYLMYKLIINNFKIGYLNYPTLITHIHNNERITTNNKKIKAEKYLLKLKLKHKDILTYKEKRKIIYRYKYNIFKYYLNNKKYIKSFIYLIYLTITSPIILLERLWSK